MSQTGYTPILIYSSSTGGNAPAAGNLTNSTLGSELAINITDGKLFYKDNANAVQVIGWKVVPATAGGTGQTSYTTGDLLYASSSTALSKLADVATGNALISGGVGVAPSWGKIGLTTHVSGTLPIANGGTNQTAFTGKSGNVAGLVFYDGTSLANDATVTDVGYDTSTNTVKAANLAVATTTTLSGLTASTALALDASKNIVSVTNTGSGNNVLATSPSIATPTLTGDVSLSTGNIVQGTAAKGINFTANSSAAGKSSQLLNYYEEGTWTITLTPSTSGSFSLNYALGAYTKIGRIVTVQAQIQVGSASSPVGSSVLMSLPFAIGNTLSGIANRFGGMMTTSNNGNFKFTGVGGDSSITCDINAATVVTGGGASGNWYFSFTYITA